MFDIHTLWMEDFRSYAGSHRFDLPTTPGLFFITGDNQREPRLESNGAGKSTLLDAIYWCLYGKTLRGLRGGDVVNWNAKGCFVGLKLTLGSTSHTITRTQSPNSLEIDGKPVDQETLQKHIILGDEAFQYAVVMPQFGQSFFELTPAAKLTLFSQIMNLDYWLGRSKVAAEKADLLKEATAVLQQRLLTHEDWIKKADAELNELAAQEATFEKEQQYAINELNKDVAHDELKITEMAKLKAETNALIKAHTKKHQQKVLEVQTVEDAYSTYAERREAMNAELVGAKIRCEAVEESIHNLLQLKSTCPTCLQNVDAKHLGQEKKRLGNALVEQKKLWDETTRKLDEAARFAAKTKKDLQELSGMVASLNRECTQDQKNLTQIDFEIISLRTRILDLKKQIGTEQKRPNPYTAMLDTKDSELAAARTDLEHDKTELEKLVTEYEATNFWVSGFKRLRLHLIEETLRALELEVNSSLTNLGLEGWQIEFDVERENKSGGVTKGFVVFVRNADHPDPVRFEAWSGGEAQRLQLAGDLGLANLIMLQAGLHNKVEYFDEPSKHLSRAGLLDLAETLHQRALNDGKRIFLIDHNTVEFGEFAAIIKVVKDDNGSKLEYAA